MSDYDVIVIGAGPGGYPAAIRAAQLGKKTACIEKAELGGVCLNWGCIPSKALLKSAELANKIRHAEDFGLKVTGLEVDYPAVVARSRKVATRFNKGVAGLFKKYGVQHLVGTATIAGPGTVRITGADGTRDLTADHIIVATGARAKTFPSIAPDGDRILTYREAIVLKERPEVVTVLGAGAIGLEFAYFWNGMGAQVTVVEAQEEILPVEDRECAKEVRKIQEKSGIIFKVGAMVDKVERAGDKCRTILKDGTVLESDRVLVALGIRPNSEDLGLEALGVKTDRGFIVVDDDLKTNVKGIYAVGDVTTRGGLAHTATAQAHVCVDRIAGHQVESVDYGSIPGCTYCQPQIASIGLTEEKAKAQGIKYKVGKFPFLANGKAQGAGTPEGFVKVLIGEAHNEIIGAHIVGADATEMIIAFGVARSHEATAESYLHTVHAHPTSAEAMFEAVAQAMGVSVHI